MCVSTEFVVQTQPSTKYSLNNVLGCNDRHVDTLTHWLTDRKSSRKTIPTKMSFSAAFLFTAHSEILRWIKYEYVLYIMFPYLVYK